MKLIKSHWIIAYRRNKNWIFVENPEEGWAADPFLFKYNDRVFLFAEIMSYRTGKGYIGCCEWNGEGFGTWRKVIKEEWHLSYPNVFEWNGKIYMLPEQYQSGEIALYECLRFPTEWKRLSPLKDGGQYVDSTVLFQNGEAWLFTLRMNSKKHSEGKLLRAKLFSPEQLGTFEIIDALGGLYKRPGGHFLLCNGKTYRVAQNCDGEYGRGLVFYLVNKCDDIGYQEEEEKRIYSGTVVDGMEGRKYIGIHTYNRCGDMEVIDLKYKEFLMEEFIWRVKRKIGGRGRK